MEAKSIKSQVITANNLPDEIWLEIFSFLPQCDHHSVGRVSKRFEEIIDKIKVIPIYILKITEKNVKAIRAEIKNQNIEKISFKILELDNIESIEDIKFILKSIGRQVDHLSINKTAVFEILKGYLINIKSLKIDFNGVSEINIEQLNLRVFPLLENLIFVNNAEKPKVSETLLLQLKGPKKTLSLKYLMMDLVNSIENELIEMLYLHADTLETLDIFFYEYLSLDWTDLWLRMSNLRNLHFRHKFDHINYRNIFFNLSKKNPLKQIELDGTNSFDDSTLTLIVEKWMNTLEAIDLSFSDISDLGLLKLGELDKLRSLRLNECKQITNTGLLMGIPLNKNFIMENLYLMNLPKLYELALNGTISSLPNLRHLELNNVPQAVTNTSLASIFRYQTQLRCLYLNNCPKLTDEGFTGFGNIPYSIRRLRGLKELSLQGCHNLSNSTLNELRLPKLRVLRLSDCHKITLKGIEQLVKNCPSLEELELPSTVMLDDNVLLVIGNGLKCLNKLTISSCANLLEEDIDHITDVFDALKDPITNGIFSYHCGLDLDD